jgi:PAS domain-containing protein
MAEWNDSLEAEFGRDVEMMWTHQHGPWPVPPDTPSLSLDEMKQLVADSVPVQEEFRRQRRDGSSYGNRWSDNP